MVETAARYWRRRYGKGRHDPAFRTAIPEEVIAEMIAETWDERDVLLARLRDPDDEGNRKVLIDELKRIELALGLDPTSFDPIADYWRARQLRGEFTAEDFDITADEARRRLRRMRR